MYIDDILITGIEKEIWNNKVIIKRKVQRHTNVGEIDTFIGKKIY